MTITPAVTRAVSGARAAVLALAAVAAPAAAQLPADASWRTIESAHFRITYEADLEPLARHAAASAERAHAALSVLIADAPRRTIDIVVADNLDFTNGYATPFPSNRIVVYARPPVDVLELQYTRDWIELVVTHELAHIFHLDVTSGFGRVLRTVFGRAPLPWPVFPAIGVPLWSVEGLAVGVESTITEFGRVHGTYNEMIVRTAALAGELDEFDRLGSSSTRWPGGARTYVYGSLFMDYLARRYGPDAAARVVRSTAGAVIPPPLWFGRVGSSALGVTFRDAYRDWERETIARADTLAEALRAQGLTSGQALTEHRAIALHPRFSRDGSHIAYAAHDWRLPPQLRIIDAATGAGERSTRLNQPASASWVSDDALVTAEADFVDAFRVFSDLRIVGNERRRITRSARLHEPDASRDGRIVAVETDRGTNRLVFVDRQTGDVRPLTEFESGTHYALPRFSPAGDRVAAARWSTGGVYDIVVIDTLGATLVVTDGFGVNAAPAWSPDGQWLLFGSDRTGIPNLYAADIPLLMRAAANGTRSDNALRQVTNVLTGTFHPDVSPDGQWIAYSSYHVDGFRIERMPFDPAQWRTPAPAGFTHSIARRDEYDEDRPSVFLDSVAIAFAAADTTARAPRRYNALRTLRPYFWLPVIETGVTEDETYLGVWTWGSDLVERHVWDAALAVETGSGRTEGLLGYTFRGLPTIPGVGLHPTLSAFVEREWDQYVRSTVPDTVYADEREDIAAVSVALNHARWRVSSGLAIRGERVWRSRHLIKAPANLVLIDPREDLWGARANVFTARFVTAPLSISREAGYTLQVAGRRRWDRDPRTFITAASDTLLLDGGYRELSTWDAAYIALPLPGFARHVLALRFSGLLRDGPRAPLSSIGGAGGSGFSLPGIAYDIGGSSLLLPVRGFRRGARAGTNAWTATAEYRFPIVLIDTPLRLIFFDRLSGAVFADAGHAWCDSLLAASVSACASTSAGDAPLMAAGAELTARISLLGFSSPVRFGAGVPLRGPDKTSPRFYILSGSAF